MISDTDLRLKSIDYRKRILKLIKQAKGGHTGGSLSCIDILNVLYNSVMNVRPENFSSPDGDRYVQSKGHSVEALYVVLADLGFFPRKNWRRFQSTSHTSLDTQLARCLESNTIPERWGMVFPLVWGRRWLAKSMGAPTGSMSFWEMGNLRRGPTGKLP